jgi:hypothetical protein
VHAVLKEGRAHVRLWWLLDHDGPNQRRHRKLVLPYHTPGTSR